MEDWRKRFLSKPISCGLSSTRRRTTFGMNSTSRPLSNVSNTKGSGFLHKKEKVTRKSTTRRLSFPKHDDSISLMNMESLEVTSFKIPGRRELTSTPLTAKKIDKENEEAECVSHKTLEKSAISSGNCTSSKPNLGLSEETWNYMMEFGIVNSEKKALKPSMQIQQPPIKQISEPNTVLTCPQNDAGKNFNIAKECSSKTNTSQTIDTFRIKEVCIGHQEERKNLIFAHNKELTECITTLISKQHRELNELDQRQNKELEAIFNQMEEHGLPKVMVESSSVTESNKKIFTPDNSFTQGHFFATPQSGVWRVSEKISVSSNKSPNIENSTFEEMTLVGKTQFLDTPATRQLVRKRIMKGIESVLDI